jgi:hypothetical protein
MSDAEARMIVQAISELARHHREWAKDYCYCSRRNEFTHQTRCSGDAIDRRVDGWFQLLAPG